MFLLSLLAVVAFVFWLSAAVSEIVMTSSEERALGPLVRVGFGFLLIVVYFSAAWQLMSIRQAWVLGIALAVLQVAARPRTSDVAAWLERGRAMARAFAACLCVALVFAAPLVLSGNPGPFTEGGGDVSIYADTAKLLYDHDLTEFGLPSASFGDLRRNLAETLAQGGGVRLEALEHPLINPPAAENASYRVIIHRTMSAFLYTPYAMLGPIAGDTNYAVFFGVEAFLYACILGGVWHFFRRLGRRAAILGVATAGLSHGLVSVLYNTYAAQSLALAIAALVLAALPTVRVASLGGLRSYGAAVLICWVTYIHYLSVVLPLLAVRALYEGPGMRRPAPRRIQLPRPAAMLRAAPAAALVAMAALLAWAGTLKSLTFATTLVKAMIASATGAPGNPYMGEAVAAFSLPWFSFLFGMVSQQHYAPFVRPLPYLPEVLAVTAGAGCLALGAGLAIMAWRARAPRSERGLDLWLYAALLLTVALHLYLVRTSLYTQAKGAQNVLPLLQVAMLLPFALPAAGAPRVFRALGLAALAVLLATLAYPRVVYVARLAAGLDRSTILEHTYLDEARRILAADANAFVLVEPRISADVYLTNQAFFGARVIQTQHLVHSVTVRPPGAPESYFELRPRSALDFVRPQDLPHLWVLGALREERWPALSNTPVVRAFFEPRMYRYRWEGRRLADRSEPALLLSADSYERGYGERAQGDVPGATPIRFSYVRNGLAAIYLPPSSHPRQVEVELQPRSADEYARLLAQVEGRARKGEFGPDARIAPTGRVVRMAFALPPQDRPSLATVARSSGEYFVNVRLDGRPLD